MTNRRIREDVKQDINHYINYHCPVGGFLYAVLCSNLFESIKRADGDNLRSLVAICQYIYNNAPNDCYGTMDKVDRWLHYGRIHG